MNREEAEHIVDEYTNAIKNSMMFAVWQLSGTKTQDVEKLRECLIGQLILVPTKEPAKTGSAPIEIHEPLCFDEALCKAYELGKTAYADGMPCEPSLDEGMLDMMMYLSVERSGKLMQKWRDGWEYEVGIDDEGADWEDVDLWPNPEYED